MPTRDGEAIGIRRRTPSCRMHLSSIPAAGIRTSATERPGAMPSHGDPWQSMQINLICARLDKETDDWQAVHSGGYGSRNGNRHLPRSVTGRAPIPATDPCRIGAREPSGASATCGAHISHSGAQPEAQLRKGAGRRPSGCWQGEGSGFTDRRHTYAGLRICGWLLDFAWYSPADHARQRRSGASTALRRALRPPRRDAPALHGTNVSLE